MDKFRKRHGGSKARKRNKVILAVFLSGVLCGISLWQGERLRPYAGDMQIRYHGQGISRQAVEQMKEAGLKPEEENYPKTAAWNVEYDVKAENPALDLKQDVTCIMVDGQMEQVVKDRLLAGTYGFADDEEGCIVSSKTAWELFGSIHVTGECIRVKGMRFLIRGVTTGSYPMVILAEKRLKAEFYSNVSLSLPGYGGLESLTEDMMMRFGFPEHETRVNGSFYYAVVRLCYTLPGWALLASSCFLMQRTGWIHRENAKKARRILFVLTIAAIAACFIRYGFRFSEDFIPTRWSDFSFYSDKFRQIKENLLAIATLPKTEWDAGMIRAFWISLLCSAEACVLLFVTGERLRE